MPAAAQKELAHEHPKQQAAIFPQNGRVMHLRRWRISRFPRAAVDPNETVPFDRRYADDADLQFDAAREDMAARLSEG